MPIIPKEPRTKEQFAMFVFDFNQLNPKGFRQPGKKGLTLVEKAFLEAGLADIEDFVPERSERSKRKIIRRRIYMDNLRKEREAREEAAAP